MSDHWKEDGAERRLYERNRQLEAENADLKARIDALTSYEPDMFVNDLKKQNAALKKVLKEVRTFLEVAPFDFRNGNTYGPYDEGDVIGWEHHKKLLDEVKEACDWWEVSDLDPLENMHIPPGTVVDKYGSEY